MSKKTLSPHEMEELRKRMENRRYRVGNITTLAKACACGSLRAYEHEGKLICIGCQTTQTKG